MAAAKPKVMVEPALDSSLAPCGSTFSWISLVAFHSRNKPPAIRIMSFHEKLWPNTSITGSVSCTIQATVLSSARRMTRAMLIPMRRALERYSMGSLLVRMEMKIRLSMPSTISMATKVARATQAVGLAASSSKYSI
ncbi:hypothetical protein D3C80_1371020 [compost metagenome]